MPKPQYYIRMNIDGVWYFLWKIIYRHSRPIWLDESELDKQTPRLYKTLVMARNSLDLYAPLDANKSEVVEWKGEHASV